jgi:CO/xanthine dehydrogenase FAD-binding subunit
LDINTITEVVSRPSHASLASFGDGDAWLGGGTWLFSEPQPGIRRLIDLDGFNWTPIEQDAHGLVISATCKIAELKAWTRPASWSGGVLIDQCCDALLGSFKIWNMASVGGNLCLALPAGPMTSLAAGLGGTCTIWTPEGSAHTVPAAQFVTGVRKTVLMRGELLRSIHLPALALSGRTAFRQVSLTPRGRSGVLLIGTLAPSGETAITVTASTVRPIRLVFGALPRHDDLRDAIEAAIAPGDYHDDIHGHPAWRRHLTITLAEAIRLELAGEAAL